MGLFGKSLAGAGYVVLNVLRGVNIFALLAATAASAVMLAKPFTENRFFFFEACNHVFHIIISAFLIVTELPFFKSYISREWPLFSSRSGFITLGCAMIFLGVGVLGNLNDPSKSQEEIGLTFWRIILGGGIVVLIMGFVNILASYVFRDTRTHLTARQVRSHGAVASHKADVESVATPKPDRRSRYRSFFLGQKRNSLPSYHSHARPDMSQTSKSKLNISRPMEYKPHSPGGASSKYSQASPKAHRYGGMDSPELTRPDLAHHPAMAHGNAI